MIVLASTPLEMGAKFILVVQDIFIRNIYTVSLAQNNPRAVATAFQIILTEGGLTPTELNTDMGAEFTSDAFPRLLQENGISHRKKDPRDRNAIATLERAIQTLKLNIMNTGASGTWAERLARVTKGQNEAPHDNLRGSAPNDVRKNRCSCSCEERCSGDNPTQHKCHATKEEALRRRGCLPGARTAEEM